MTIDYTARTVTFDQAPRLPSAIGRLLPAFVNAWQFARAGTDNVWRFAKHDFHFFAGMSELIRRFYRCIEQDVPPPIAHRDILRVTHLLECIWRELANQRTTRAVAHPTNALARPA